MESLLTRLTDIYAMISMQNVSNDADILFSRFIKIKKSGDIHGC